MDWISVKERLPGSCWTKETYKGVITLSCEVNHICAGTYDYVMVYAKSKYHGDLYSICRYDGDSWSSAHCDIGYNQKNDVEWDFETSEITHWAPFPEPPLNKGNNDNN